MLVTAVSYRYTLGSFAILCSSSQHNTCHQSSSTSTTFVGQFRAVTDQATNDDQSWLTRTKGNLRSTLLRHSPTLDCARERAEVNESAEFAERKLPSLCARRGSSLSDSCSAHAGKTLMLLNKGHWLSMIGSARHSCVRLLMEGKCQLLELCSTPLANISRQMWESQCVALVHYRSLMRIRSADRWTTSNMKEDTQNAQASM